MALESYYGVSSRAERNPAGNPAPALMLKRGDSGYWDVLERMGMDTVKNPLCGNPASGAAPSGRQRSLISNAIFDANQRYYETQGDAIGALKQALDKGGIDWKPEEEYWEHIAYEQSKMYPPIALPDGYWLHISMYRMPSGRYEMVAHIDNSGKKGKSYLGKRNPERPEYPSDIYDRASRPSFQGDLYDRAVGWESLGGRSARLIAFHPTQVLGSVMPSSTAGYQWVATTDRGTKNMNDAADAVEYVEVNAFGKLERDLGESRKNILRALGGERRNPEGGSANYSGLTLDQITAKLKAEYGNAYITRMEYPWGRMPTWVLGDGTKAYSDRGVLYFAPQGRFPQELAQKLVSDWRPSRREDEHHFYDLEQWAKGGERNPLNPRPVEQVYVSNDKQDADNLADHLIKDHNISAMVLERTAKTGRPFYVIEVMGEDLERAKKVRDDFYDELVNEQKGREQNPSVFGSDEELIEQAREQGDKGATATRRRDAAGARFFREHYNKWLRLVSGDDAALKAKLEAAYREGYSNVSPTYGNPEGPAPANDMMVAKAILAQLGGHKFLAMTGAAHLVGGANSLSMKIGRNSKGINHVMITLDPSDTYTMKFYHVRGANARIKDEHEGVYAEDLQRLFTQSTGMYTSMGTMGRRNPGTQQKIYALFNEFGIPYGYEDTEEKAKSEALRLAKTRGEYGGFAVVRDTKAKKTYKFHPDGRITEMLRNPADLTDTAFDAGKHWGLYGAAESGVSNANVRRYGFVKWWNDLDPGGRGYSGSRTKKSSAEKAFNEGYAIGKRQSNEGYGGPRRNPEGPAADMYESFHGAPSEEIVEVTEDEHYHSHLASLGELRELKVATFNKKDVTITFAKSGQTKLCSNEEGTQLYIVGGDQSLDLKTMGLNSAQCEKDFVALGVLHELTYQTKKEFHKFQLVDYYHELGEETGYQPILTYDTMNKSLSISGGEYKIRPEGIVN